MISLKEIPRNIIRKNIFKVWFAVTVEDSILKHGGIDMLDKIKIECAHNITECYQKPEYLVQVLDKIPKKEREIIKLDIISNLKSFDHNKYKNITEKLAIC